MQVVVSDANILINLMHVDLLSLLGSLERFEFVVPDQVLEEVTAPEQAAKLDAAIERGWLRRVSVKGIQELTDYADLKLIMGKGESACLATSPTARMADRVR